MATVRSTLQTAVSRRERRATERGASAPASRDPVAFLVLIAVVITTVAAITTTLRGSELADVRWAWVLAWMLLCSVANVLPVPAGPNVYLSMSSPVNIAIAVLLPPGLAVAVVAAASISEWELRRETTVLHALYNRAQLGLAAAAAGTAFRVPSDEWTVAGAVGAVIAYHACNWLLVALAERTTRHVPLPTAIRRLVPPGVLAPLSYLALGLMGVALAATFRDVGAWAVALLMLPVLAARQAVAASVNLERAQRAQRLLANRLIDERERERARIAANIHDVVLQDLAAMQLVSSNVRSAIDAGDTALASLLTEQIGEAARGAVDSLRAAIANLRSAGLDDAGLMATFARHARGFTAHTGIEVDLRGSGHVEPTPAAGLLLYECLQEALRNVDRHASARRVTVVVQRRDTGIELRIRDDGIGVHRSREVSEHQPGIGLTLLRDKVELSGGAMSIESPGGGGTELVVSVPLDDVAVARVRA